MNVAHCYRLMDHCLLNSYDKLKEAAIEVNVELFETIHDTPFQIDFTKVDSYNFWGYQWEYQEFAWAQNCIDDYTLPEYIWYVTDLLRHKPATKYFRTKAEAKYKRNLLNIEFFLSCIDNDLYNKPDTNFITSSKAIIL